VLTLARGPKPALAAGELKPALAAGELVIEASGEGPELSDIPAVPFVYAPSPRHTGAHPVEKILDTLVSPRMLLGLPEEALEVELGGAFPYVRDPQLESQFLIDDESP
jgi:hypothetical protein